VREKRVGSEEFASVSRRSRRERRARETEKTKNKKPVRVRLFPARSLDRGPCGEKPKGLADSAREKRKNRRNLVPDVIAEK
jgi:hypothetical protein